LAGIAGNDALLDNLGDVLGTGSRHIFPLAVPLEPGPTTFC